MNCHKTLYSRSCCFQRSCQRFEIRVKRGKNGGSHAEQSLSCLQFKRERERWRCQWWMSHVKSGEYSSCASRTSPLMPDFNDVDDRTVTDRCRWRCYHCLLSLRLGILPLYYLLNLQTTRERFTRKSKTSICLSCDQKRISWRCWLKQHEVCQKSWKLPDFQGER